MSDGYYALRVVFESMTSGPADAPGGLVPVAHLVNDASAAVAVSSGGAVSPVPGLPGHRLLADLSSVVGVALHRLAGRRVVATFLCPDRDGAYLRVTAVSYEPGPGRDIAAVVALSPGGDLRGLTPRELEVLGRLIDGALTHEIARRLSITDRTVNAHLEHIRAKLDAPTSMVAAVRSLQQALFVPPQLAPRPTVRAGRPAGRAAAPGPRP